MKRRIENPKILLLDCNLEYKKGESQTNIEIMKEEDFSKILEMEESYIKRICDDIIRYSPDLVKQLFWITVGIQLPNTFIRTVWLT